MRKFREGTARQQLSLLPASVDEYVGKDDSVRFVDSLVDELNLESIEQQYSSFGRPAYSPRMLVKLLIYGKLRGMRSSRELSTATRENIRFIFLCCNERPDFRTISDFRKRFHQELAGLLVQTIQIGLDEGLIQLQDVAIDGTKIPAYASRKSFATPEKLEKLLEQLEKSFKEDIEHDEAEDNECGEGDEPKLPPELQNRQVLKERIKAALKHHEAVKGEKPKQVSITDPECRFAKGNGGINPVYNAQTAVDGASRMAVAGYVTNAVSDNAELVPVLEAIEANTGRNPERICADTAYNQFIGFHELNRRNIDGYIPQREGFVEEVSDKDLQLGAFFYNPATDTVLCPKHHKLSFEKYDDLYNKLKRKISVYSSPACADCSAKSYCSINRSTFRKDLSNTVHQWLAAKLHEKSTTAAAAQMMKLRASVVEPVFGHIKAARKLQRFLFRGMKMLDSMWKLELAAYNIEKLVRFRMSLAT